MKCEKVSKSVCYPLPAAGEGGNPRGEEDRRALFGVDDEDDEEDDDEDDEEEEDDAATWSMLSCSCLSYR